MSHQKLVSLLCLHALNQEAAASIPIRNKVTFKIIDSSQFSTLDWCHSAAYLAFNLEIQKCCVTETDCFAQLVTQLRLTH